MVYHKLLRPMDATGKLHQDSTFRVGDIRWSPETKRIVSILYYPDEPYYRYKLENMPNISYSANELKLATTQTSKKDLVRELLNKKRVKNKIYYRVWLKGHTKNQSKWESEEDLVRDGLQDLIDNYSEKNSSKNT